MELCAHSGKFMISVQIILLFCCCQWMPGDAVNTCNFFDFGAGTGDTELESDDDGNSTSINLSTPIQFYGTPQSTLYVNTNGILSFQSPFTEFRQRMFPLGNSTSFIPLIAPFWDDVDIRRFGNILYRLTSNATLLQRTRDQLQELFPSSGNFTPTQLFIATWDRVAEYNGGSMQANTFQVVIAADGQVTFVFFIYGDIQWGDGANIGFNAGDGTRFFMDPRALTNQTLNVEEGSNVGVTGLYIYRVDCSVLNGTAVLVGFAEPSYTVNETGGSVSVCINISGAALESCNITVLLSAVNNTASSPDDYRPINSQPVTFSSAPSQMCVPITIINDPTIEPNELFTVMLDTMDPGVKLTLSTANITIFDSSSSCVSAGFTSCCTGNECRVGNCFCDQGCFGFNDCCSDITEVPCFPNITIGFAMSNCTVSESVGDAMLTVTAQGDFPSVGLQSRLTVPVEVSVLVRTEDITAEAGLDYSITIHILTFRDASNQSVFIPIIDDRVVEDTESFRALLSSSDNFDLMGLEPADVLIQDNDVPEGPPTIIMTSSTQCNQIDVSWNPPPLELQNGAITRYSVCYEVEGGTQAEQCVDVPPSPTSTALTTGISPGTAYLIRIAAATAVSLGPFSGNFRQMTLPEPPTSTPDSPGVPTNVTMTATTIPITLPIFPSLQDFSHFWVIALITNASIDTSQPPTALFRDNSSFTTYSSSISPGRPYIVAEISSMNYPTTFVLGADGSSLNDFYRNGPLLPNTEYTAFVWGFVPSVPNGSPVISKRQASSPPRQYGVFSSSRYLIPVRTATLTTTQGVYKEISTDPSKSSDNTSPTAAIIGGVVAVVVVMAVIVIVIAVLVANHHRAKLSTIHQDVRKKQSHVAISGDEHITTAQCEAYEAGHVYEDIQVYQNPEYEDISVYEIPAREPATTQCPAYTPTSRSGK